MLGLFVTATDTGAGKTHVACAIARAWRHQGRPFRVCKPVATGAEWTERGLWSDDTRRLAEAAGDDDWRAITPWTFEAPAAPPVAARQAGERLVLTALAEKVRGRGNLESAVLVEGVGGLLCPLTEDKTVADLVKVLGLPLVIVARRSLGTLNHVLLTVEVAQRRGLRIAGVVVSETTPVQGLAEQGNVEELRRWLPVPLLGVLPHDPGGTAAPALDWWALAEDGEGS